MQFKLMQKDYVSLLAVTLRTLAVLCSALVTAHQFTADRAG